jgi:hypothetical protein
MSCPECECDLCLDAHPITEHEEQAQQGKFEHEALATIYYILYRQQLDIEHYFSPELIAGHLAVASMQANQLNRNIQVGLNILADLLHTERT